MISDITRFETARLRAERICEAHHQAIRKLWQDEQVMASIISGVRSDEECLMRLAAMEEGWTRYGIERWALFEKTTQAFAGLGGLRHNLIDGWPEIELGYALHREFWGRGLATEISLASLEVGFRRLGCEHISAMALAENHASRRVMEKIGMRHDRDTIYRERRHAVYELTHAEWTRAHSTE